MNENTSSSDSDDGRFSTFRLMESKDPMLRLMIFGKLKKMINSFIGVKLNEIDKKLIRGIFLKKHKDFDEQLQEMSENMTLF